MNEQEQRQVTDEPIYVMSEACADCPYTDHAKKGRIITRKVRARAQKKLKKYQCFLECTSVTVARFRGGRYPKHICCAGFFEQHWDRVPALAYAKGRNMIWPIYLEHLPTLTQSGMILIDPKDPVMRESEAWPHLPSCSVEEWESRK